MKENKVLFLITLVHKYKNKKQPMNYKKIKNHKKQTNKTLVFVQNPASENRQHTLEQGTSLTFSLTLSQCKDATEKLRKDLVVSCMFSKHCVTLAKKKKKVRRRHGYQFQTGAHQ